MSGICPTPVQQDQTDYTNPDTFDIGLPGAALNDCPTTTTTNIPDPDPEVPSHTHPEYALVDHTHDNDCTEGLVWKGIWAESTDYKATSETNCAASLVSHVASTGDDDWFDDFSYVEGDGVYDLDNVHYTCIVDHVSDPDSDPGVGVDWTTKWKLTDDIDLPHALYVCIVDHTSDLDNEPVWGTTEATYWELMLRAGAGNGATASGLVYRGQWDGTETYVPGDVLMHNNSSYVCIQSHTAKTAESGTESSKGNEPDLSLAEEDGGLIDGIFDAVSGFFGFAEHNDPSPYWELLSKGEQEDQGFLGGIFDWLGDVTGWEIFDNDWFQSAVSLLGGAAVAYYLNEWLTSDPATWEARYDGDTGYIGAYTKPSLPDVVDSICVSAGIQNYDTSLLPNKEVSFSVGDITNHRSVLEMLSQAYQFDIISTFEPGTGRVMAFRPRSTDSVKTLSLKDIGYASGFRGEAPFQSKRLQGNDLPRSVEISYFSSAFSEKRLTQSSIMRTYPQGQNFKLDVNMSLDDADAKEIADVVLMNAHLERSTYAFTTSIEHIELEAGDIITVESVGDVRIDSISSSSDQDGLLEFICSDSGVASSPKPVYDGPTLVGYTASSTTGSIGPTGPIVPDHQEEVTYLVQSGIIPLDLPPLNNQDKNPRVHLAIHDYGQIAAQGYGEASWPGAVVQLSRDGGNTWVHGGSVSSHRSGVATWGLVEAAIPSAPNVNIVDETTVITVKLKTGRLLDATSELAFLNGENRCMVGQELIYFRDVTNLGNDTYELSYLLRGRRGTDAYHESHIANEGFVLLDFQRGLMRVGLEQEDFRKEILFRVATIGLDIETAPSVAITPQFQNFRGWKVHNATIGYDVTSKAFACRFLRRYKWDSSLVNGRSNLPDDDQGGYKVAIINPTNDAVLRDFVVTTPQFSYTLAQQIEDFGSEQSTLKVSIVPMSKTVGPGHPTIVTYGI